MNNPAIIKIKKEIVEKKNFEIYGSKFSLEREPSKNLIAHIVLVTNKGIYERFVIQKSGNVVADNIFEKDYFELKSFIKEKQYA